MISTSADYKTQVQNNRYWKVKAQIDYTDYNLDNTITTSVSNPDPTSDDAQMVDGIESPTYEWFSDWSTFEWGKYLRSTEPTENEKGALGARPSSIHDGTFDQIVPAVAGRYVAGHKAVASFIDYPTFAVNFLPRTVQNLKVVFDDKLLEWGVDFDINLYVDDAIDTTVSVIGNTTVRYTNDLVSPVLLVNKIEVIVYEWNIVSAKVKIMEMFTSISEQYDSDDIISLSIHEDIDPAEATTPIGNITANTCNLRLLNEDSNFDNDNEMSILAGNIIKNRRITPSFILNNLTGDEIPGGIYYSTRWDVDNNNLTAEVSAQDIIGLMNESQYTESQFIIPGIDEVFTYTTTADFNLFTLSNMTVGTDELLFGGGAVECGNEVTGTMTVFGHKTFGDVIPNGAMYCGTAIKQVSYTYTPGTTATIKIDSTKTEPLGSDFKWYISFKTVDEYTEIDPLAGFSYLPEDPTATSQNFKVLLLIQTQSLLSVPSLQDMTVTVSEKITLLSLAALVIEAYDDKTKLINGNYTIDQDYGLHEIPVAYILPQTYKSALKDICEAVAGRGYAARDGSIVLSTLKEITTADKVYTNDNMLEFQKITNPQTIYNKVTVNINTLEQAASLEDLAKIDIDILDTEVKTFKVEFSKSKIPADTITLSGLPASVTATDQTDFVWGSEIELTNASGSDQSFTLTISGKPYTSKGAEVISVENTESIRLNGITEYPIDNPFIQTMEQAEQVAQIMADSFGTQKREANAIVLSDPSVELADSIDVNGDYYLVNTQDLEIKKGLLSHTLGGKR